MLNNNFFYTQLAFPFVPKKNSYDTFFLLQKDFDLFLLIENRKIKQKKKLKIEREKIIIEKKTIKNSLLVFLCALEIMHDI